MPPCRVVCPAMGALAVLALLGAPASPVAAQHPGANALPIDIPRLDQPIQVDGELDDPQYRSLTPLGGWLETNPGDNIPAAPEAQAWLAYDDEFLYVAFDFRDPEPRAIRAPLGDHDNLGNATDYGGVILDARNDRKTAQMFLANARGLQYDAITSDATGEDSSPDFFWDAAGRITERGWQLELRIPFSSIRYAGSDPERWGILLYRNRPRDFRYQYFTSRLPRDSSCFICNVRPLTGLRGLPSGNHWVVAPYTTASQVAVPTGEVGSSLRSEDPEFDGGADLKWLPNPDTILDAAINPDFSQIESDEGQITANERFAIFQPEKRPFFLESIDLLSTPITAVYTRTVTDPRWGARATGGSEHLKYTVLTGQDRGGGSVILPGPRDSGFADQDFDSWVALGRVRKDLGQSTVSFLYSGREIDRGGSNRVLGPDFQWRPSTRTTVTGQFLYSFSHTPDRTELATEWDGRKLDGHAGELWYSWANQRWDVFAIYHDVAEQFRADNGFVPRVGYRALQFDAGRTLRPTHGPVRRLRLFLVGDASDDRSGFTLTRGLTPGFGMDAKWNSFVRVEFNFDRVRAQQNLHDRFFVEPQIEIRPGKVVNQVVFTGALGDQVDFANDRDATGVSLQASVDLRPTSQLRITTSYRRRWLDVRAQSNQEGRLFTAEIPRVRAVYTFSSRAWVRLIGEWNLVDRRPELWTFPVAAKSRDFGGSAVFAYKLNWQTVLFLGYSEAQTLDQEEALRPFERQGFFKLSYAFRG